MKKYLLYFLVCFCTLAKAQNGINFSYDSAGNQTTRSLCLNCFSKPAKEIKEIEALTEDDLLQFSENDAISYYPNPVKEELYLNWQASAENPVNAVNIYSITGQLLKYYNGLNKTNTLNLAFQDYPTGVYLVLINYSNGDEKSIKIIKQ